MGEPAHVKRLLGLGSCRGVVLVLTLSTFLCIHHCLIVVLRFEFGARERIGVVGRNGVGKSTVSGLNSWLVTPKDSPVSSRLYDEARDRWQRVKEPDDAVIPPPFFFFFLSFFLHKP